MTKIMLDWAEKNGFSKLAVRNVVLAVLTALVTSNIALFVKLEGSKDEMVATVTKLKDDRVADLQLIGELREKMAAQEAELSAARREIENLKRKMK